MTHPLEEGAPSLERHTDEKQTASRLRLDFDGLEDAAEESPLLLHVSGVPRGEEIENLGTAPPEEVGGVAALRLLFKPGNLRLDVGALGDELLARALAHLVEVAGTAQLAVQAPDRRRDGVG